jgi:hypothetical protein
MTDTMTHTEDHELTYHDAALSRIGSLYARADAPGTSAEVTGLLVKRANHLLKGLGRDEVIRQADEFYAQADAPGTPHKTAETLAKRASDLLKIAGI